MKRFHAHTLSHPSTPSHMPIPSVAVVTSNVNDTHIPSLCRLTNTQCNLPMGNQSRANPDSYHSTLGKSDKHDHVFYFRQQSFSAYTAGLLHLHRTFRIAPRVSHTHTGPFGSHHGSPTPEFQAFHLKGLTTPFLLHPTHLNSTSLYDLSHGSFIGRFIQNTSSPQPRMVNNHTVHSHPARRDVTLHMNAMMPIHISNSNDS